jgi:hypothetical protein
LKAAGLLLKLCRPPAFVDAFVHRITAMDSEWKNNTFMHGLPPMPHLL